MKTYAFVDASNIIYGTRDEGWKVDFKKLFKYLEERYNCRKIYYFAGFEKENRKQQSFYKRLKRFGYELILKEVKLYRQFDGAIVRKANCDVDLTFYAMRDKEKFNRGIFLTGDGDFAILFGYFIKMKKEIIVIANAKRTAKEIKILKGMQFNDFGGLRGTIER
ncbi:MAG: NYN domain-containing protein [Candidatus Levybacteria bacterium]|nr:NYN domain-containing protein [Candidatus Levybacteria bacterium]